MNRARISLSLLVLCTSALSTAADPVIRVKCSTTRPALDYLSWDTEGGPRVGTNLLRAGASVQLRFMSGGKTVETSGPPVASGGVEAGTAYRISVGDGIVSWTITTRHGGLEWAFLSDNARFDAAEVVIPFDPKVTPTTILPTEWNDKAFTLPGVVNALDFGPMLLRADAAVSGTLEGSRADKWVNMILRLPLGGQAGSGTRSVTLTFSPLLLESPAGLKDDAKLWKLARRGWLNIFQPCAKWGEQGRPFSAPAGILGNNVISDPCSICTGFYGDQMLLLNEIAPTIKASALVRRTIDWWLDNRMRPTGEMVCYWDYGDFLDANAGPIVGALDYVTATGDMDWLKRRIERIEFIAEFLVKRDIDGDGLIEATQSGNLGTLVQPKRSCAWWDALNCGHKDAYTNAIIYRAWRCLADLERKLNRPEQATKYDHLADRLKAAYVKTLLNPKTGWLAWWKSEDGELHDYAAPTTNGMAIEYGLVEPDLAREILKKLWAKIDAVGFTRFDLGIPPMLIPVRRGDYLLPDAIGCPKRDDGTDTFGQYMNGGITAGHVLGFLVANYMYGDRERADTVLRRMLERQSRGEFQNGVTDEAGKGIDWTTWDGKPSGYEGYLSDTYRWLEAVLLREKVFRDRLYAPLRTEGR